MQLFCCNSTIISDICCVQAKNAALCAKHSTALLGVALLDKKNENMEEDEL